MRRSRSGFFGGVITGAAGVLLVTGIMTGGLFPRKGSFSDTEYAVVQANDKLEEINKYIDDKFIFDTDSDTLSTAMLKEYISGLGDRYLCLLYRRGDGAGAAVSGWRVLWDWRAGQSSRKMAPCAS